MKVWSPKDVRALAQRTVDGRKAIETARGEYLRALIETTQAELAGNADPTAQRGMLAAVQHRFVKIVKDAIATDEILLKEGYGRKETSKIRNRRMNFTRTNYRAIRCWLRVDGHDLLKLDAAKTSKPKLEKDGAPSHKHAMTKKRIEARADKYVGGLLAFTKQLPKDEQKDVLIDAIDMLARRLQVDIKELKARGKSFLQLVA